MVTAASVMTADELLAYPAPDHRVELVRGRLHVGEPPGSRHGEIEAVVVGALSMYLTRDRDTRGVERTRGRILCGDAGFWLSRDPDTVRAPDAAYISRDRCSGVMPEGYADFAPDLVVEVRSPSDRPGPLLAKVADWLEAGTRVVWVIDPPTRQVAIYRDDGNHALLAGDDVLREEELLPGFALPLVELFAE
jgi:Uma2 family endonuclease